MILTLPYPPSVNTYYTTVAGRRVLSAKGRQYKELVWAETRGSLCFPACVRLSVSIALYPPDKRRRDLDNTLKSLLDALTAASVWADDSQIDELTVTRREVAKGGWAVVTIETREA